MRREGGILELTLHTDGDSLRWGLDPHHELALMFYDVAHDRDNRVVILTGAGKEFSGPRSTWETRAIRSRPTSDDWDEIMWHGRKLEQNLLDIEVPVISAINGPAYRHMELPLLSDIVLAADTAVFEDPGHFTAGNLVPGDSIHIVCAMLMGPNRARYFQLMGQTLTASEAKELGMVNEILKKEDLLPRAWAIARALAQKPLLLLRYSRIIFTQEIRQKMMDQLPYHLTLEGLQVSSPTSGHT
jgi:enoyl-CoA hydratase/carnithine racemase